MIHLSNAGLTYAGNSHSALRDLTLSIRENEFVALMGRNGSGKSTLARLLNGLLLPTTGRVEVDGMYTDERANLAKLRERVGLLFPFTDNRFIAATVEDEVAFGPENMGLSPREIRSRVDTALRLVSMQDYPNYPPEGLSIGQKQKVCLAGLLALRPRYIVLDEPNSMLDDASGQQLMQTLLNLNRTEEMGIILFTHRLEEAIYAERIVILDKGQIGMDGPTGRVIEQTEKLSTLGIEPLEISSMVDYLNQSACFGHIRGIFHADELVDRLCP